MVLGILGFIIYIAVGNKTTLGVPGDASPPPASTPT